MSGVKKSLVLFDYLKRQDTFHFYNNPENENTIGNLVFKKGPIIIDIGKGGKILGITVERASKILESKPNQLVKICEEKNLKVTAFLLKRILRRYVQIKKCGELTRHSLFSLKIFG